MTKLYSVISKFDSDIMPIVCIIFTGEFLDFALPL